MLRFVILAALLLSPATLAGAGERVVEATGGALARALQTAQAGDILRLSPGTYAGPITIDKAITLDGGGQAAVQGSGTGSVITITAPDVTVTGLIVSGSGSDGGARDAGVQLTPQAARAQVLRNQLLGNLVGVDVHGSPDALVARNIIQGRQDFRMNDRGNGVYVWNAPGTRVIGNDLRWGRDGIFVNTSKNNDFSDNLFRDLRFAVHYMYAHDSRVSGNISVGNHLGYAVMNSNNVVIEGNLSRNDRDHGIMLNFTNDSLLRNNWIEAVAGKCAFVYNAHKNRIEGNRFQACGTGIHFTAGSERNEITGNGFVGNRVQVQSESTAWVDWAIDGRGNYWSDHNGFDLDGDGIADSTYRPNDTIDRLLWTQPAAAALLGSPAVQLLRWSQSRFPALLPGGIFDSAPLMGAVAPRQPQWEDVK